MLRTTHHILPQKEAVLGMLRSKLQEEGLRTYLLAYGRFYSSLSIAQLCDMFELPERKVGAAIAQPQGAWDAEFLPHCRRLDRQPGLVP